MDGARHRSAVARPRHLVCSIGDRRRAVGFAELGSLYAPIELFRYKSGPLQKRAVGSSQRHHRNTIGMIKIATIFATLIIGLMAGPAVSLYGSPTVSPVTDAA